MRRRNFFMDNFITVDYLSTFVGMVAVVVLITQFTKDLVDKVAKWLPTKFLVFIYSLIVLIASSFSGIFEETGMLEDIQKMLEKMSRKAGVYFTTIVTSAVTASFFCNQTLSSIMTHQLMKKIYEEKGYSKSELAIDLENTVIMISALVPWNIAVAVPLATLSADEGSIIYALYIYLVPFLNMIRLPKKIKAPGI
jgi:NhaC family Na+:H+ antiporter